MNSIFKNQQEGRLRSGWRILLFLVLFWTVSSLIFVAKMYFPDVTKREYMANYSLLIVAILAFAATIATLIARPKLDKRSFTSLGLKFNGRAIKDVLFGFVLSGVMAGTFLLTLMGLGLLEFEKLEIATAITGQGFVTYMSVFSIGAMLLLLLEHILVGYWEELVFRGYIFQNMIHGLGLTVAIVISCIIYGLIHATNPNATIVSSVIIIAFGYLRIYGYLSTKMLWLSIGMHIGWNFFQGPIFGFGASGHSKASLMHHSFTSDTTYLTGGNFGPEGSLLIIPILVVTLVIMRWYVRRQEV